MLPLVKDFNSSSLSNAFLETSINSSVTEYIRTEIVSPISKFSISFNLIRASNLLLVFKYPNSLSFLIKVPSIFAPFSCEIGN